MILRIYVCPFSAGVLSLIKIELFPVLLHESIFLFPSHNVMEIEISSPGLTTRKVQMAFPSLNDRLGANVVLCRLSACVEVIRSMIATTT